MSIIWPLRLIGGSGREVWGRAAGGGGGHVGTLLSGGVGGSIPDSSGQVKVSSLNTEDVILRPTGRQVCEHVITRGRLYTQYIHTIYTLYSGKQKATVVTHRLGYFERAVCVHYQCTVHSRHKVRDVQCGSCSSYTPVLSMSLYFRKNNLI